VPLYGRNSYTMCWQPFHRKVYMTTTLPHHKYKCQLSVNNVWSSIMGNQGIVWIYVLITVLLTTFLGKNMTYKRKKTDSKIINIAYCKTCKKKSLAAECLILIRYYQQTAKIRVLYESTDGPAGQPTDNRSNSDWLGDLH